MDAKTLFNMHKIMLGNEVIMTYSGYMSQALLTSIAAVIKQKIEQDDLPKKVMRNIFSVFVEQYENVVNLLKQLNFSFKHKKHAMIYDQSTKFSKVFNYIFIKNE